MKWILEPEHTVAHFTARHMMITDVHGQFNKTSGVIYFDPADRASLSLEIEIEADGVWTGVVDRDNHLRSADFLDVKNHPKIVFKSTGAEILGSNLFLVHGQLTIRGVTRPITLHAESFGPMFYEDEEGTYTSIGFTATACLNREDFGMTWNNDFGSGNFMVGKHIHLTLNAEADLETE